MNINFYRVEQNLKWFKGEVTRENVAKWIKDELWYDDLTETELDVLFVYLSDGKEKR